MISSNVEREDGWVKWGQHVLAELKRQNDEIKELRKEHTKFVQDVSSERILNAKDIAELKTKMRLQGGIIAALISGAVTAIINFLMN